MTTSRDLPSARRPGHPEDAAALHTDADVLERVESVVGPATAANTLWLLLVDGDDRQAPVVMPIDAVPSRPDALVDGLGEVLDGVIGDLTTPDGPGSVIFVRERTGSDRHTDDDRAWAAALAAMCERIGVRRRGTFVSTPRGVQRLD